MSSLWSNRRITDAEGRRAKLFLPLPWTDEWREIHVELGNRIEPREVRTLLIGVWIGYGMIVGMAVLMVAAIVATLKWNMVLFVVPTMSVVGPLIVTNTVLGEPYKGDLKSATRNLVHGLLQLHRCPSCGYRLDAPGRAHPTVQLKCSECGCVWNIPEQNALAEPDLLTAHAPPHGDVRLWWRQWRGR